MVINLNNEEDEECFKLAVLTALHQENIDSHRNNYRNLGGSRAIMIRENKNFPSISVRSASSKEQQCFCECLSNRRREREALHSQKG